MKKLLVCLIIVLFFALVSESYTQSLSLKAGLNLSDMLGKSDDGTISDKFDLKPGIHIGGTLEFPINEFLSIEPGLFISTKGFKMSEKESFMSQTAEYNLIANLWYLDIPILGKISHNMNQLKIYGFLGPNIGIGLSGKKTEELKLNGNTQEKETETIDWGSNDEDDLKRLDFGLVFGAGAEINNILFSIAYEYGLTNISAYTKRGTTVKNRVWRFTVGYRIN